MTTLKEKIEGLMISHREYGEFACGMIREDNFPKVAEAITELVKVDEGEIEDILRDNLIKYDGNCDIVPDEWEERVAEEIANHLGKAEKVVVKLPKKWQEYDYKLQQEGEPNAIAFNNCLAKIKELNKGVEFEEESSG